MRVGVLLILSASHAARTGAVVPLWAFAVGEHLRSFGSILFWSRPPLLFVCAAAILGVTVAFARERRTRLKLRHCEAQMSAIVGSAMDGIITVDSGHNIVLFNSAAENIFGCAASAVIGTQIERFVPEELRSKHSAGFDEFSKSDLHSRFGEFTALRADGRRFPIEASISQIEASGQKLYSIILRDITERRVAEEKQQQFESAITKAAREWRLTFDAVASGILFLDIDGNIKRLNRAAKELMAIQNYEDAIARPIQDFADHEPWRGVAKLVPEAVENRSTVSCQFQEEGGRTWYVSARIAENEGVVVVVRDITQVVSLRDSLRRSEAMASIGALVAGVAHEVRNPLFGISSTIDAFEACFGERDEYGEYLSILRREVEQLRKLMQELLEYGKPPSNELSAGSLDKVIQAALQTCHFYAKQAGVTVVAAPLDALPPVALNSDRLVLLFKNLIENAIQHSARGGEVRIEAQLAMDNSMVECTVVDSGPGFREQDLPRIFEPFFSRRQGGTGLGLSIVQRIAEEHSGTVCARNCTGQGALIQVTLPVAKSRGGEHRNASA